MDTHLSHPWLVRLIRYFFGFYFLVSGILKLFPLGGFLRQVLAYKFPFDDHLIYICAIVLISYEIWVGISLVLKSNLKFSLRGAQILLACMIPVTIWGTLHKAPTCGCFGNYIHREPSQALIEDCLLLVVSFILFPAIIAQSKETSIPRVRFLGVCIVTIAAFVYGWMQLNGIFSFQAEKLL